MLPERRSQSGPHYLTTTHTFKTRKGEKRRACGVPRSSLFFSFGCPPPVVTLARGEITAYAEKITA